MSVPSPESSSSQLLHWEQPPSTGQGRKTSSCEESKSYHIPNTTTQRDTQRNLCYWSSELNERAPGQAREWCFICNCWVRAATDPTMTTDPSAGDPKRIYKVISLEFVVPCPNSTHRDAEPSPIPGQESAGVWDMG